MYLLIFAILLKILLIDLIFNSTVQTAAPWSW